MSFRVVDNETNEILLDTLKVQDLVEYLEKMESNEERPMKAMIVREADKIWE